MLLTLFGLAYFGVSGNKGGGIFGLDGVRVPFLFGNDLPMSDLPYSKGFMKFECPEMFDF